MVNIKFTHPQFVFLEVVDCKNRKWNFFVVYASLTVPLKQTVKNTMRGFFEF